MVVSSRCIECMKSLLMVFNFIFWLTGIVVLGLGIWVKLELYRYIDLSDDLNTALPYVMIAIGATIVIVGSFACCYTLKGEPAFLYIYSTFLFLIFAALLGAGISGYVFRTDIKDGFSSGLKKSMNDYGTLTDITTAIDEMQALLHCCGVDNYTDWKATPWAGSSNETVPESCCKLSACDRADPLDPTVIYTKGCYSEVVEFTNSNLAAVGGTALAFAVLQFFGCLLSFYLAKNIYRSYYEEV